MRCGPWRDITNKVIGDISGYWGLADEKPTTLMADTGEMSFVLNNDNSQFVPGVTGAIANWNKGTPIRLLFQDDAGDAYVRFYGAISELDPDAGLFGGDKVGVVVVDWLDYAATHPLLSPAIVSDKRSDEMATTIIADMPIAPLNTEFEEGVTTFDTAFDTLKEKTTAYSELSKITLSEFAPCYLRKDPVYGETLVLENEHTRNGLRIADFTLDNSMKDIELIYGENVVNYIKSEAFPRDIDANISVLFETKTRILIAGNGVLDNVRGNYTDPEGGAPAVGANMIAPVATTDYTMNADKDGGGADLTADLTVTTSYGASGVTYKFENTGNQQGWIWIRARGYLVERYSTVSKISEDSDSQDEYGVQPLAFKQKYQQEIRRGQMKADSIVEWEREPRLVPKSVTFIANRSADLMDAWLNGDVGKVVRVKKDDYDIDVLCYIQNVEFKILPGGLIMCKWILQVFLTLTLGFSLISAEFGGGYADFDAIDYGYLPEVSGDDVTSRTISAWIEIDGAGSGAYASIIGEYSNYKGMSLAVGNSGGGIYVEVGNYRYSPVGQWRSPDGSLVGGGTRYHILVTYDASDSANDPSIYINNVSQAITETYTPGGALGSMEGNHFVIGNEVGNGTYTWPFDGDIEDVRVWNRILTADERATIYGGGDVEDGLVFQGPVVRTAELSYFDGLTLDPDKDRVLDAVFGRVGFPNDDVITSIP